MENRAERINSLLKGDKAPPWSIQIQPSNMCNLKCKQCARNFEDLKNDQISQKRLLRLVDEAVELGVKEIEFTGRVGEPMVRDIGHIIEKIKKHNIKTNLLTNGTLLDDKIIKKIVKNEWDTIVISLDSPYSETHDKLRGITGTYKRIIDNIGKINKYKEVYNKDKPDLLFLCVLNRYNKNQIPELVILADYLNVNAIQIRPMIIHEEAVDELDGLKIRSNRKNKILRSIERAKKLSEEKNIEFILEHDIKTLLDYFSDDYNRESPKKYEDKDGEGIKKDFNTNSYQHSVNDIKCLLPFSEMVIFAEGTVSPCCIVHKPVAKGKYIDSILDKSLEEVWYGEKFENYREKLRKDKMPEACDECFL